MPIVDDDFTSFHAWLVDGFPIWIGGRVHRQADVFDIIRSPHPTVREEESETLPWGEGEVDADGGRHWTL